VALVFGGKRKPGGMGPRTPLDPLEQQLTDRIAAVLRALRNSTDVDAYVHVMQRLDPEALERLLMRVELGGLGDRIEETLRGVVITGGSAEGQRIIRETPRVPSPFEALQYPGRVLPSGIIVPPGMAPPPDVEFTIASQRPDLFSYVDHRATEYARVRAANLVVEVDSANRLAIRRVIHESFTQPATADQTARKLRSMVGLHTRWARAVVNFDDANYRRFLNDGMTQEAARARADVLTKRYSDRLIRRRAEMIARTEIQQAQNWGRQAAWDGGAKAGYVDMASMKEWRTAPMGSQYGPPCRICTELRGTRVPYNGTFANGHEMPPAHPHCFVAGTIVDGPAVTGSTARWFEGEVVELRLSEGPGLTGTPNHPVLTTRGWVALGEIREGDEVIRNAAFQRAAAGIGPDDDQHPARIENVANAVGRAGGVPSREVPVAGPDFHGDGAGSEVAVVRADRLLGDDVPSEVEEPACQHRLTPAAVGTLRLDTGSEPLPVGGALSTAPDGVVGSPHVGAVLLGSPVRGHEAVRVGQPSGLRAGDPQDSGDDVPAHPESLRERLHRLAPEVSLGDLLRCGVDVVTSIGRSVFAGHVYNLETVDGWYSANGIVVHNCRCTAVLIPPSRGLTGLPSQDMDSWLEQLDELDAESIAEYDAVAKHGDPSRPGYHLLHPNSRAASTGPAGMKMSPDGSFKYGELNFGPDTIETPGPGFGYTDPIAWRAYVGAGHFIFWDGNYATRTVSANMMGLPPSRPRGAGGLSEGTLDMIRTAKYGETGTFDEEAARPLIREGAAMLAATAKERMPMPLYRGLQLEQGDARLSAEFGDEITMPVSAFATTRGIAETFARGTVRPDAEDSTTPRTPVMLTVMSGARGYNTKNGSPSGDEVVTQGRFRVERNVESRMDGGTEPIRLIVLRQTAYYDVTLGAWVEVAPDA